MKNIYFVLLWVYSSTLSAQTLEKSILQDDKFYFREIRTEIASSWGSDSTYEALTAYMRVYNFDKPQKKNIVNYLHVVTESHYPIYVAWDIINQTAHLQSSSSGYTKTSLVLKDSAQIIQERRDSIRVLDEKYKGQKDVLLGKYLQMAGYHTLPFYDGSSTPLFTLKHHLCNRILHQHPVRYVEEGTLGYTFLISEKDTNVVDFFIRDTLQMTHWRHQVLDTSYWVPEDEWKYQWEEVATYSRDTSQMHLRVHPNFLKFYRFHPKYPNRKVPVLPDYKPRIFMPSGKKHYYRSISDSLFLRGNFEIYQPADSKALFFINLHHGGIYTIHQDRIEKIAQIDFSGYKFPFMNTNIYVEDRNNN